MSMPFGMYCLSNLLVFSLPQRSAGDLLSTNSQFFVLSLQGLIYRSIRLSSMNTAPSCRCRTSRVSAPVIVLSFANAGSGR